jgi:hypothetical protein
MSGHAETINFFHLQSNVTINNVTFIQSGQLQNVVNQLPAEHNPHSEAWTPQEITNLEFSKDSSAKKQERQGS